jgi:hypothetical protein
MEQAGDVLRRMAVAKDVGVPIPKQTARRLDAIELVRRGRDEHSQELAYNSRPFVLCGLPIRRPQPGSLNHTRKNGRFTLEIVGHPDFGLLYGQDRLIPLWLATLAVRQKSRMVFFDSGAQILRTFGLPVDGVHYRRLVAGFKRVFASTIYFGDNVASRQPVWDCRRFHFFDRLKIWCSQEGSEDLKEIAARNLVILSEPFWQEIQAHPISVDLAAVRSLAHNPGCLDFYMWLTWRCYNARRTESIPLFGPAGLAAQLGVVEYSRSRNFRKRLRTWLATVSLHWPDCPARIISNGESLVVGRAAPVCRQPA